MYGYERESGYATVLVCDDFDLDGLFDYRSVNVVRDLKGTTTLDV